MSLGMAMIWGMGPLNSPGMFDDVGMEIVLPETVLLRMPLAMRMMVCVGTHIGPQMST